MSSDSDAHRDNRWIMFRACWILVSSDFFDLSKRILQPISEIPTKEIDRTNYSTSIDSEQHPETILERWSMVPPAKSSCIKAKVFASDFFTQRLLVRRARKETKVASRASCKDSDFCEQGCGIARSTCLVSRAASTEESVYNCRMCLSTTIDVYFCGAVCPTMVSDLVKSWKKQSKSEICFL